MTPWICATCCVEFSPSLNPPARCPICEDERQYVGAGGQRWTSMSELGQSHTNQWVEIEPCLTGIGVNPSTGIGQRALLVQTDKGNVLWDCTPLITAETIAQIKSLGGVVAMTMSHPHFYAAMVSWSQALGGVPILLPEADKDHVMRPDPAITYWQGDALTIVPGVRAVRCGGHFAGSTVLHWAAGAGGDGILLTGDTIQVVPDAGWLSFMRSYPNLIPLPGHVVRQIAATVAPLEFDRLYGGWWDKFLLQGAHAAVQRSADRYVKALD
ncbi:hypothetical protein PSQ19_14030 [Devosia algicola]|uniref:Metallo-beta-lactamase domain-containing protein n=1 Tax=Devosia algicola TaxID=3026418 RepID=A0ABY7YKZ3_9HYPH|nr:hypothetical protein [Devosia algicola]WDR01828.1 hypothetical protein PSQ19_14030 [Devosia algicola]